MQLHPDQEQRITFVPETPTRAPTNLVTIGDITTIPETQHTGTNLPF